MQKILAIDDKKDNLTTLSAVLSNLMPDCSVSTALSGREGIEKAGAGQPDVILLDVKMPDMDGFETCRRLKTDPSTSAIPIIMITAIKTDHQSRIKGLELGADAFLAKPIDEVELVAQVKVALRIKIAEDALRRERDSLEQVVAERTRELTQKATLLAQTESISHTGSWRHELETDKVTWSEEMYNIFGLDRAAFIHNVNEVVALAVHPEDRPKLNEINAAVRRDGIPRPLEYRIVHPDKGVRWVYGTGEQEVDAFGRVIALVGFLQDITEHKRLESERELLITAIEQTPVAIALTDPQGSFQYINPAFEKITGYTGAEVIGQNPRILKSGRQNQAFYADLWKAITDGRVWKGRMTNKRKDGSLYMEDAIISPVVDGCDRVMNFVSIKRDITAEMDMENKLRQAQKMEAIGTLAGGIAHDFNNILGAIIGYAEMIRDDALAVSASVQDINQVLKAGNRAKELVKQILAFGRQGESELIAVQPATIINEAVKLLRASIPATIAIQQDIDPEAGAILADPTQIHQIMMNLCTNAFHAMEILGGTLSIGLNKKIVSPEDLDGNPHLPPGNYLQLSIEDSGEGIAPEILDKIFDPFFTTKEVAKGPAWAFPRCTALSTAMAAPFPVTVAWARARSFI